MTLKSKGIPILILLILVFIVFVMPRLWFVAPYLAQPPEVEFVNFTAMSVSTDGVTIEYSVNISNPNTLLPITIDRIEVDFLLNNKSVANSTFPEIALAGSENVIVTSDGVITWEGAASGGVSYLLNKLVKKESNLLEAQGMAFIDLPTGEVQVPFSIEREI